MMIEFYILMYLDKYSNCLIFMNAQLFVVQNKSIQIRIYRGVTRKHVQQILVLKSIVTMILLQYNRILQYEYKCINFVLRPQSINLSFIRQRLIKITYSRLTLIVGYAEVTNRNVRFLITRVIQIYVLFDLSVEALILKLPI